MADTGKLMGVNRGRRGVGYGYDPELAAALALVPSLPFEDLAAARRLHHALYVDQESAIDGVEHLDVSDLRIPGLSAGDPSVEARLYVPLRAKQPFAAVLYFHGGGFALGGIDDDHAPAAAFARNVGAVVLSVGYRLAPENPYPAALDDCYAALCWLSDEAADLGIDPSRVAVAGSSAGGGLAAGVALLARDRSGPAICFQLLNQPVLDDRLQTASMQSFVDTPVWNRTNATLSWRYYLGPDRDEADCYAAPARADDLSGLPPAYIAAAQFDPLRDEAISYASRLLAADVSVELHTFPGTFHGSDQIESAAISQRQRAETYAALRQTLRCNPELVRLESAESAA